MTASRLPDKNSAAAAMLVCITARLFMGMTVDFPGAEISAWICPLTGLLLTLPFLLLLKSLTHGSKEALWQRISQCCPRPLFTCAALLLILLLVYDCGLSIRLLAGTAKVLALNRVSVFALTLPLGALLAIQLCLGADASANAARIWMMLAPVLLLIVLLLCLHSCKAAWLTPLLGSGIRDIASSGIYCGGSIALLCVPWLFAQPGECRRSPLFYVSIAAAIAALLLAFFQTLTPAMPGLNLNRSSRIEQLLFNGRAALSMHFVLIFLWYTSLLQLISTEITCCRSLFEAIAPKAPPWLTVMLLSVLPLVLANSSLTSAEHSNVVSTLCFPAVMLVFCGLLSGIAVRGRRVA